MTHLTITDHEAEQVERANASGRVTASLRDGYSSSASRS